MRSKRERRLSVAGPHRGRLEAFLLDLRQNEGVEALTRPVVFVHFRQLRIGNGLEGPQRLLRGFFFAGRFFGNSSRGSGAPIFTQVDEVVHDLLRQRFFGGISRPS
jgi:hypothetical protein